uniref:Uncharacterized protein n=1 Tax=Eutreptiella gymnastica TaxID=73025 RepID=A0A7S4FSA4_9EUGL
MRKHHFSTITLWNHRLIVVINDGAVLCTSPVSRDTQGQAQRHRHTGMHVEMQTPRRQPSKDIGVRMGKRAMRGLRPITATLAPPTSEKGSAGKNESCSRSPKLEDDLGTQTFWGNPCPQSIAPQFHAGGAGTMCNPHSMVGGCGG